MSRIPYIPLPFISRGRFQTGSLLHETQIGLSTQQTCGTFVSGTEKQGVYHLIE